MRNLSLAVVAVCLAVSAMAAGQEHATVVRSANLLASPTANADKVLTVDRGMDLKILESKSSENTPWVRVTVAIPGATLNEPAREATGWLPAKPVVAVSSPNAEQVIYGEAVDSEVQAETRGGRKGAAMDAMRLYLRAAEFFPNSENAGESMWRSADIRWQLSKSEKKSGLETGYLQAVINKFPKTKWADLAAFDLLDSEMCEGWKGQPDCPAREAEAYERYTREHPQSPKFAEALYNAAFRQGVLVDIYRIFNDKEKSNAARVKALELAQELAGKALDGDWKSRGVNLVYKLQHNIALYGVSE